MLSKLPERPFKIEFFTEKSRVLRRQPNHINLFLSKDLSKSLLYRALSELAGKYFKIVILEFKSFKEETFSFRFVTFYPEFCY